MDFFHGDVLVLLPIVALVLCIFVWTFVYAQPVRSEVNRAFLYFSFLAFGWMSTELLLFLPVVRGGEIWIYRIGGVFWLSIGVFFYNFVCAVVGRPGGRPVVIGLLLSMVAIGFTLLSDKVIVGVNHFSWGTSPKVHFVFHPIVSALTAFYATWAIVVLWKKRVRTTDAVMRKILTLILIGAVVGAGSIAALNVILPDFFRVVDVPRWGASGMGLLLALVFYAVTRYRFLTISPRTVAEEIFDQVKVGILLCNRDGEVEQCNKEAALLLGEKLVGKSLGTLVPDVDFGTEFVAREVVLASRQKKRTLSFSVSRAVRDDRVLGTIVLVQDVSAQKAAEEVLRRSRDQLEGEVRKRTQQLRQAQRMETIGMMAGGIAHDFNNNLAVILGFSRAALEEVGPDHVVSDDLREVCLAAERGKDMVDQITGLARKEDKATFAPVRLQQLLAESLKLLRISTPEQIVPIVHLRAPQTVVNGDSTQLCQSITNLYTNACYALKKIDNPILEVSLDTVNMELQEVQGLEGFPPGVYAVIEVADNGPGIKAEIMKSVFDPFFTTKPRGEGTGLGLASCQMIVRSHGGELVVESRPFERTTFRIYLPVLDGDEKRVSRPPQEGGMAASEPAVGEHILWVDDDLQIGRLGSRMLERKGYKVSVASSGKEALSIYQEASVSVDLLVTDFSMPEMDGAELARCLWKKRSDLPVIMVSGFGDKKVSDQLSEEGPVVFLSKPVETDCMRETIRTVLDGRSPSSATS